MSKGLRLDVARAANKQTDSHVDQGVAQLSFDLPGGKRDLLTFRMDQTIGHAKVQLESRHGIQYDTLDLIIDGRSGLADPLSFNDFPSIRDASKSKKVVSVAVRIISASSSSSGSAAAGGSKNEEGENESGGGKETEHKGDEEEEDDEELVDEEK